MTERVTCPEDPVKLLGRPLGQYHCPACGCMQVAGLPHMCDADDCLLENCACLPEGVTRSPNLEAWMQHDEHQPRQSRPVEDTP